MLAAALAIQSQVADTSPFRALPLPAPGRVRGASGAPGPDYWQQRADYVIRATLDTSAQTIRGSERIHYVNHSPDTLAFLWVQIEQNLFPPNSNTYALTQPPLHFAGGARSEEHTSELQSQSNLVCRLLLEKKKKDLF